MWPVNYSIFQLGLQGVLVQTYRAFIVRCWNEGEAAPNQPGWRFSIGEIGGDEQQHGFGSLDALFAFLRKEMETTARGPYSEESTP
jgi:hypothetical protein